MQAHLVAASGEFVGTFMFLFFAYATQLMVLNQETSATAPAMDTVYISLGYGFSLLVTAWAFYRISGGLFNPAVSFFQLRAFFSSLLCILLMLLPSPLSHLG